MGSKINKSAMEELMGGLVSVSDEIPQVSSAPSTKDKEEVVEKRGRKKGAATERISTLVSADLMNKVRAIALKEGLNISSIINVGVSLVVKNYEEKHGPVRIVPHKKGDIDKVFGL